MLLYLFITVIEFPAFCHCILHISCFLNLLLFCIQILRPFPPISDYRTQDNYTDVYFLVMNLQFYKYACFMFFSLYSFGLAKEINGVISAKSSYRTILRALGTMNLVRATRKVWAIGLTQCDKRKLQKIKS